MAKGRVPVVPMPVIGVLIWGLLFTSQIFFQMLTMGRLLQLMCGLGAGWVWHYRLW